MLCVRFESRIRVLCNLLQTLVCARFRKLLSRMTRESSIPARVNRAFSGEIAEAGMEPVFQQAAKDIIHMNAIPQQALRIKRRSSVPATVVAVDGDPDQLSLLCSILEKTGLDARVFNSATDALESMAGSVVPALFIVRLCMSRIDGWQFCRLLRSSEYSDLNQVPILVLCDSLAGKEPQRVATALGGYVFLANPFDTDAFIRRVLNILRGQLHAAPVRVLIVEADKYHASLLSNEFTAVGYTADTALTVREADDAFARADYDIAVIDYELPDGPGDVLMERFQSMCPECVSIMMCADQAAVSPVDLMCRGAAACVQKPCEPAYLLKLCEQTHKERSLALIEYLQKTRMRELRENQNRFSALTMALEEAIIIMDMGGAVSFWSAAAVRIFGYKPEDALGRTLDDLIAPQRYYAEYQRLFPLLTKTDGDSDPGTSFELTARCKDGHEIIIKLAVSTVQLSFDCHTVVIAHDVAAGKPAEEALRESRQIISSIVHSIDTAVMSYSIKKKCYLYISPSLEKIYGRKLKGLACNKFTPVDFIHPDDAEISHAIKMQLSATDTAEQECRIVRPDGKIVWVNTRLKIIRDTEGRPDRIDKVITDITGRKNRELTMRKNFEQMAGILNSIDDIIITAEAKGGGVIYVSPSFEKFFGPEARNQLHEIQALSKFVCPDHKNILNDHIVQLTRNGFAEHVLRAIQQNGDAVWFRLRSKTVPDAKGDSEATRHVLTDITQYKQEEKKRDNLQDQLAHRQTIESVGNLAGGVAHDFNNMLSVIMGHADLAMRNLTPGQPLHTTLKTIQRTSGNLAAITRNLLAFAGKQARAPKDLDIHETVESKLTMLRRLVGEQIRIDWQPGNKPGRVTMDPAQLEQVLSELCSNSKKAINEKGTITIATGSASISEALCAHNPVYTPGEFVTLTVADNGKAIEGMAAAGIFEPYCSPHDMDPRTGLGLPAVYGIIKQNGGFIDIASEAGSGTRITIYLPRNEEEEYRGLEGGEQAPAGPKRTATVLLVEHEPDNLELYAAMLESLGCTVLSAATHEECLCLAKSHDGRIDLLITDLAMPGINGRELANEVLTMRLETVCLFISGYSASFLARNGMLDPGLNLIETPFSLQDFTGTVTQLLNSCDTYQ